MIISVNNFIRYNIVSPTKEFGCRDMKKLFKKLGLIKEEPKKRCYERDRETAGVPALVASTIMDESFHPDEIRSSHLYSTEKLCEYCELLLEESKITKERYIAIVGNGTSNLPAFPLKKHE
jgi:hypothetical protein